MILLSAPRGRSWRGACLLVLTLLLGACSSAPKRPDPAPLPADPQLIGIREAWHLDLGPVAFPLVVPVVGHEAAIGDSEGTVAVVDTRTGELRWRASAGASLAAGVGFDGRTAAVVTGGNELVALREGKVLWRQPLSAVSYTPPLVAGERVFVLGADRSVSAFDGESGRRLWNQSRSGEALVLRQAGVLMPVGNTLVAGLSGRLVGLQPLAGATLWEVPIASPRGTNDVERLVDMVTGVARQGSVVCARAFQSAVGCVDAAQGRLLWSKPAEGGVGLTGDDQLLFGVEFDGTVQAWRRADGERAWNTEQLRYRQLTAPLAIGPALVLGDVEGRLYFLSRKDGSLMKWLKTDGSAIAAAPVLAGNTLVAVTAQGRVLGLRPE